MSTPAPGDSRPFISPPQRFLQTAARLGAAPAYYVREEKGWVPTSWNVYRDEVRQAARALVALGVKPGDAVAVMGYNRPEWVIMDLAAMMIGASVAGIYFTASPQDAAYVIDHSQCEIALAGNRQNFETIAKERSRLKRLRHIVMMRGAPARDPLQMTWESFLSHGESRFDPEVERRLAAIRPSDTGCFIYTSGTTGPPKAVQLSHRALTANLEMVKPFFELSEKDCTLSYLPLAHIVERIATIHFQLNFGNTVYFARSLTELGQHLVEVRPHFFGGVPRVFEKIAAAAQVKTSAAKGIKGALVRWAMKTSQEWHRKEQAGLRQGAKTAIAKAVASGLVLNKAKKAMGLDRARYVACGAAPIPEDTLRFLAGLDIPIREMWGMSETCAAVTGNSPGATKIGSVGRPFPGVEIKINPDGEILVKGPTNFSGYAKDPEATARTLIDGWLYTGDIGHIDAGGFLYITGRKKDIIITSGGKNIAPANLEVDLASLPLIESAIVCGDRRPYLSALIALNAEAVEAFAAARGLKQSDPLLHEAIQQKLQEGIDTINARHSRAENIRRFAILPEPLSIEKGDITPTLKVRRQAVMKRLEPVIDALYENHPLADQGAYEASAASSGVAS